MKENIIKKYPIYYKNKKYEIRIEKEHDSILDITFFKECINIYEVYKQTYCLCGYTINDKTVYDKVFSIDLNKIKSLVHLKGEYTTSENYYIELFKEAFKQYIDPIEIKEKQLAALNNWDGIII